MHDFISLGTGNSRFLKSVENFKTLYPTYDAFVEALVSGTLPIDFNGVNAAGILQQGTALNKDNLLKDITAKNFGLDESAVPDDVLYLIAKNLYNGLGNQYLWSLTGTVLVEGSQVDYSAEMPYATFYYSTELNTDDLTLVNPSSGTNWDVASDLPGKYIYCTDLSIPVSLCVSAAQGDSTFTISYKPLSLETVTDAYVNSHDPNAYPIDDGNTYRPLGKLGSKAQIATGSYTGTGTYGASNPCSLTFDFVPKLLVVIPSKSSDSNNYACYPVIAIPSGGWCIDGNSGMIVTVTFSGNIVKWYSSSVPYQANSLIAYYYMAVGQ